MDDQSLADRVAELEEELRATRASHEKSEQEFSQKRAVFKELFMQKEQELQAVTAERDTMTSRVSQLAAELEDLRSVTALLENNRNDEVDMLKTQHKQETQSLEHIVKESIAEETQAARAEVDRIRSAWEADRRTLFAQIQELQGLLASRSPQPTRTPVQPTPPPPPAPVSPSHGTPNEKEEDSVILTVARNLRKQLKQTELSSLLQLPGSTPSSSSPGLDEAMRRAQQDVEVLRAVVGPYEEEIKSLKDKIRQAYGLIDELEGVDTKPRSRCDAVSLPSVESLREQVTLDHKNLSFLRSQYVAVTEQLSHLQRQHYEHLQQVQAILTDDQKRQLEAVFASAARNYPSSSSTLSAPTGADLGESPVHQRRIRNLLGLSPSDSANCTSTGITKAWSGDRLNDFIAGSLGTSNVSTKSLKANTGTSTEGSRQNADSQSLFDFDTKVSTDDDDFFATRTSRASVLGRGERVISEKEWSRMHLELDELRKRSGGACQMCANYEDQLQTLQGNFQKGDKRLRIVQSQLESEQQTCASLRSRQEDLENQLKTSASAQREKIDLLADRLATAHTTEERLEDTLADYRTWASTQMATLMQEKEAALATVARLERDYSALLRRQGRRAQEMLDENLSLPGDRGEVELMVLRLREDLIGVKAASEQIEETLKNEIAFLKQQIRAEQTERTSLEETMSRELSEAQSEVARLASCESEYLREKKVREEGETRLAALEARLADRDKLADENREMRQRVQNLQVELENSESVQKDFVKLSQTLQIQLENLREEDCEVRWQHDEDVTECTQCHLSFGVTRKRYHCRHCCKIYCADCLGKVVYSGPNKRPARVCNVCHTMLVKEAVPYFSQHQQSKSQSPS